MDCWKGLLTFIMTIFLFTNINPYPYNMHWTDHSKDDSFCLAYNPTPQKKSSIYQETNYCSRDTHVISLLQDVRWNDLIHHRWTFKDLQRNNVTVKDLISWSASIEVVERYQVSLNQRIHKILSSVDTDEIYVNCTLPWFGPDCRFMFDPPQHLSFTNIVQYQLADRIHNMNDSSRTCYTHLSCEKSWQCLDWREICDWKVDCLDGSDERHCWLLYNNECTTDEFRCQNGQCIPKEFFNDDPQNADCLDATDEPQRNFHSYYCSTDPNFRCEEISCKRDWINFPCGDGDCTFSGSSECVNGRGNLFNDNPCFKAVGCLMKSPGMLTNYDCTDYCKKFNCTRIKENQCPPIFQYPDGPILFGHIKFVFTNEPVIGSDKDALLPEYICFDARICSIFSSNSIERLNMSCIRTQSLNLPKRSYYYSNLEILRTRFLECSNYFNCNLSNAYRCENSTKCIPNYQRYDDIQDCPFDDDENVMKQNERLESSSISNQYLATQSIKNPIYFSQMCDGFPNLEPIQIDNQNETDETNCNYWPCNNTYTRCNRFWSCKDGADEINCSPSTCPPLEHDCVFFNDTTRVSCLPISQAADGKIDCLGGTDEPYICRYLTPVYLSEQYFGCHNRTKCVPNYLLCGKEAHCPLKDDKIFCPNTPIDFNDLCHSVALKSDVRNLFCNAFMDIEPKMIHFRLRNIPAYTNQKIIDRPASISSCRSATRVPTFSKSIGTMSNAVKWRCQRGIRLQLRMNTSNIRDACLCPPSYYGDQCQFQNDRVSLTVRFQATWDWRDIFLFVFTLIDDEQHIESHHFVEYLPIRDCDMKYNLYLQFANRWKNNTKNYFIRIDSINRFSGAYRASWIFPIRYHFLPVYRLSMIVTIPHNNMEITKRCSKPCFHGQCYPYVNARHLSFCRCDSGWAGIHCDKPIQCHCATNAHCLDDSICICPLGQYGPRCHLLQISCMTDYCVNGGRCIQPSQFFSSVERHQPICVCPDEYSGDRCQHHQSRIEILFHPSISIPSYLLVHFITVNENSEPFRSSTLKKIPFDKNSILLHVSYPFNIAVAETAAKFYLLIIREKPIISAMISAQIYPSLQCLSIAHLLPGHIVKLHLLKRMKYYHQPCIQHFPLACFYDDMHLCICEQKRHANCFRFEHNMTFDCHGSRVCENGGQCFLDRPVCPTSGSCICQDCYYGSRCQFTTKGSSLSLDTIIGYQFTSHQNFNQQSLVVRMALCFVMIVFTLGLINSFCSLLTFHTKITVKSGCGRYLLTSTIASTVNMILLVIKFWILFAWQTGSFDNTTVIYVQCILIDYFLRLLLTSQDWLYAAVAAERTMTVLQGVKFDRTNSCKIAKWNILLIYSLTALTYLHEPIHRRIIDDSEDKRTWCVTEYSDSILVYDRVISILHFSVPFIVNFLSAIIIIGSSSYRYGTVHRKASIREQFLKEIRNHKHLLISPVLLVLLALPRLIISFVFGCMKINRNPWLYLIGYFISFLPPVSTFIVFVVPSRMYKNEFNKSLRSLWKK